MHQITTCWQGPKLYLLIALLFQFNLAMSQNTKQEKMEALNFMTGAWVGTSKFFENGELKSEVPAYQNIAYDLNKSIIVIALKSETLQLHTIIYYDEEAETYIYNPYSERGARKLPAVFEDGKFVVNANENTRFIFERTGENSFREHGEQRIDGKWVTYFDDQFVDVQ